jgi:hypothetical protein
MITNEMLTGGLWILFCIVLGFLYVLTPAIASGDLIRRSGVNFLAVPKVIAITLTAALYYYVDPAWFEAAGKIGSPEFARVALILKGMGLGILVLLAVHNFRKASFKYAVLGTCLQCLVVYFYGQVLVLFVGLLLVAVLVYGIGVSGRTLGCRSIFRGFKNLFFAAISAIRCQHRDSIANCCVKSRTASVHMRQDGLAHPRVPEFQYMLGDARHGLVLPLALEKLPNLVGHVNKLVRR